MAESVPNVDARELRLPPLQYSSRRPAVSKNLWIFMRQARMEGSML